MNPVDHPHGGGEGKSKGGRQSGHSVGRADARQRTRKKHKESNQLIVSQPPSRQGEAQVMSRSSKKGPFVEERLMSRIEAMNATNEKRMIRTWSRTSTVFPEMVGAHDRRPRRPQARARVHLRADGRTQAREFAPTRTFRGHSGDARPR